MCFINKMDRMGANFYKAVDSIVNLLGAKPCILQVLLIHACACVTSLASDFSFFLFSSCAQLPIGYESDLKKY
jgi:hypothetical protein